MTGRTSSMQRHLSQSDIDRIMAQPRLKRRCPACGCGLTKKSTLGDETLWLCPCRLNWKTRGEGRYLLWCGGSVGLTLDVALSPGSSSLDQGPSRGQLGRSEREISLHRLSRLETLQSGPSGDRRPYRLRGRKCRD